ncbi:MAG: metallophosphoesterase, partial [Bdellovibrionales bacterium]|nr:metallophosphoesterase [Bdellovibrionales bacterium]
MTTSFALVTDFHIGVPRKHPVTREPVTNGTLNSVQEALSKIESDKVEFIVQLGDLLQENPDAPSHIDESEKFATVMEIFGAHPTPIYHVVGNHDTAVLSEEELSEGFGYERLYYTFDSDEFTNIVIYSRTPQLKNAHIPEEEFTWL